MRAVVWSLSCLGLRLVRLTVTKIAPHRRKDYTKGLIVGYKVIGSQKRLMLVTTRALQKAAVSVSRQRPGVEPGCR
jgi:hypothetical protein